MKLICRIITGVPGLLLRLLNYAKSQLSFKRNKATLIRLWRESVDKIIVVVQKWNSTAEQ